MGDAGRPLFDGAKLGHVPLVRLGRIVVFRHVCLYAALAVWYGSEGSKMSTARRRGPLSY